MKHPDQSAGVPGFFPAVLSGLQLSGARTQGLRELTDASWHELLAFCDLAHLTLPLVMACQDAAPGWVVARAHANLADNRVRVEKIASAYAEIARCFADSRVKHLVMKGFAQDSVQPLEYRLQSDLDLYCPPEYIPAARAALESLGYQSDRTLAKYPADHVPEMTRRRGWQWRGNAYDPEMPPSVDLHFCFWNSATNRLPIWSLSDFWSRRIERQGRGFTFPALCTIDNLAYNALHIVRDLQRGDWVLHHVYELACFLHGHAEDEAFWQSWSQCHDDSLRSLQAISFWLARDWFNPRLPAVASRETAYLPHPVEQWLNRFGKAPLQGMFYPNKHGVWLHLALLHSRRDQVFILSRSLLPFRLPAVGAPGQDATKTRRRRTLWPSQRYARYVLHVVFRVAFHLQTLPATLWHGFCWWLDLQRLRTL